MQLTEERLKALRQHADEMAAYGWKDDAETIYALLAAHSAEPKKMTDWREKCAALVDIYDDAKNNEPENRCYVDGAFRQEIDELRALLANGE